MKRAGRKRASPQISIRSQLPRRRSSMYSISSVLIAATRKTPSISKIEKPDPQSSKQVPSEPPPSIKKSPTTILPRMIPQKRKSTFDNFVPTKRGSRFQKSRSHEPKYNAVGSARHAISFILNERPINHKIKDHQSELPTSVISRLQVPFSDASPSPSVGSAWPKFTPIRTYYLRFAKGKEME